MNPTPHYPETTYTPTHLTAVSNCCSTVPLLRASSRIHNVVTYVTLILMSIPNGLVSKSVPPSNSVTLTIDFPYNIYNDGCIRLHGSSSIAPVRYMLAPWPDLLGHVNETEPWLELSVPPVLLLLWQVTVSAVKKGLTQYYYTGGKDRHTEWHIKHFF